MPARIAEQAANTAKNLESKPFTITREEGESASSPRRRGPMARRTLFREQGAGAPCGGPARSSLNGMGQRLPVGAVRRPPGADLALPRDRGGDGGRVGPGRAGPLHPAARDGHDKAYLFAAPFTRPRSGDRGEALGDDPSLDACFGPGTFLADRRVFVSPRRSTLPRSARFPTPVPPGDTVQHRLRLTKPGGESVSNHLAGHPESCRPISTPVARWLLSQTCKMATHELATWKRLTGPPRQSLVLAPTWKGK